MSDDLTLVNQIYSQIGSSGVSLDRLNALSEADLNVICIKNSSRKMVRSYSPEYQAQIRDFILNLHIATNEKLIAQYDTARPDSV